MHAVRQQVELKPYSGSDGRAGTLAHVQTASRSPQNSPRLFVESVQGYAFIQTDTEGVVTGWNPGARHLFGYRDTEMLGHPLHRLLSGTGEAAGVYDAELADVVRGERRARTRWTQPRMGSPLWVHWNSEPLCDDGGLLRGVAFVLHDETRNQHVANVQQALTRELHHRFKNALATVVALAQQTLRTHTDPHTFFTAFEARIGALSRAHGALTEHGGANAGIAAIIWEQIGFQGDPERIHLESRQLEGEYALSPEAVLAFSLVLHELGTNARKYGALSRAAGSLDIAWRVITRQGHPVLSLKWVETGGPSVHRPTQAGFGTSFIENSLAGVGGTATLAFESPGVRCHIEMPMEFSSDRLTGAQR